MHGTRPPDATALGGVPKFPFKLGEHQDIGEDEVRKILKLRV